MTRNGCCFVEVIRRSAGSTAMRSSVGLVVRARRPAAIQSRMISYLPSPGVSRLPPPWGTCAVALRSKQALLGRGREDAAAAGLRDDGRVGRSRGRTQQRQLEAVLPAALPWQAPALQPSRVRIG